MKIIRIIWVMAAQFYYEWAMREIHPTHDDVPLIIRRQVELHDEYRRLFS